MAICLQVATNFLIPYKNYKTHCPPTKLNAMKKIYLFSILFLLAAAVFAQSDFSGIYSYANKPSGNTGNDKKATGSAGKLTLLKINGNMYRFWLDVTIGWPSYDRGETDGTITLVNDTASFDNTFEGATSSCILRFTKTNNSITIQSQSNSFNCGFGDNVTANGSYTKAAAQPVFNNEWLKTEYPDALYITIKTTTANLYRDENCLFPFTPNQFFKKGDRLLNITETKSSIYTEFITASGALMYGWLKKEAVQK